jgi:hypothetical protein
MRTGIATVPLDYGRCPRWLFERMKRLSRGIFLAIREEFGPDEILKRLADPVWFQSLGCLLGFDWNSSGLTTTTLGALKAGFFDIQDQLGIYICGGKKESRKTPQEIEAYGISRGFSFAPKLIYASKMAAKVDSSLIQDGFQIYAHNLIFSSNGHWTVIQQGMNIGFQKARRYHWFSDISKNFIEEPHSGIISDIQTKPLNLTAQKSEENRNISKELVVEKPKTFLKDIKLIFEKENNLIRQKRLLNFTEMELNNIEFHWHPVVREKFDLKRLEKTIFFANSQQPQSFARLLSLPGVGPKTIRALSLVSEIIYGAKPSYEDPAHYSFSVGGKDGTPFFVERSAYDKLISIMEKGIQKSKISISEKIRAQKRLKNQLSPAS